MEKDMGTNDPASAFDALVTAIECLGHDGRIDEILEVAHRLGMNFGDASDSRDQHHIFQLLSPDAALLLIHLGLAADQGRPTDHHFLLELAAHGREPIELLWRFKSCPHVEPSLQRAA
ncbi:MAG: hypothetical protein ACREB5_10305 [Sphingomonadaceae bacterium]